mgnify:CR=1 FL=1
MAQDDRERWNARYAAGAYADREHPSDIVAQWVERHADYANGPGQALDLACGAGRNAYFLASRGFTVDAVDISSTALQRAAERTPKDLAIRWIEHDLDLSLIHI